MKRTRRQNRRARGTRDAFGVYYPGPKENPVPPRLRAKFSRKVSQLMREGKRQTQAVRIAFEELRRGKLNPLRRRQRRKYAREKARTVASGRYAGRRQLFAAGVGGAAQGAARLRKMGIRGLTPRIERLRKLHRRALTPLPGPKGKLPNPWACLECGRTFRSAEAAERATFSDRGCPGCGGSDIDYVSEKEAKEIKQAARAPRRNRAIVTTIELTVYRHDGTIFTRQWFTPSEHLKAVRIGKDNAAAIGGTYKVIDYAKRNPIFGSLSGAAARGAKKVTLSPLHVVHKKTGRAGEVLGRKRGWVKVKWMDADRASFAPERDVSILRIKGVKRPKNPRLTKRSTLADLYYLYVVTPRGKRFFITSAYGHVLALAEKKRLSVDLPAGEKIVVRKIKNPKRKKVPRAISQLSRSFQGKASGAIKELPAASNAPADLARLGKLQSIRVNGRKVPTPGLVLAADGKGKLWIVGGKFKRVRGAARKNANAILNYGPLDQVSYITAKEHIGNGKTFEYVHDLGEDGGRKPELLIDPEGYARLRGGDYRITAGGIVG